MIVYDVVVEDEVAGSNGRVTQFYDKIIMKTRPLSYVVHCCNAFYRLSFSSIYLTRQEYPHLSKLNNHVIYEAGIDYLPRTQKCTSTSSPALLRGEQLQVLCYYGGAAFLHAHVCATTFLYPFGAPHGSEPVFHGGNPTGSTGWYWLVVLLLTVAGIDLFWPIDPIASSPIIQWAARISTATLPFRDRFESLVPIALHDEFLDPKHHCLCPCIGGCVVPRVPSG